MNSLSKIFKQTAWQILGKSVTSVITLMILSIISRNFGKDGLGALTLSSTYIGVYMLIADFGFNGHLLRKIEHQRKQYGDNVFGKLLGTRIFWSLSLIAILLLTLPLFSFSGTQFIILTIAGCLAILGSAIFVSSNLIFQKNLRYDLSVVATALGYALYFLLVVIFVFIKFPLFFVQISSILGWIVIAILALYFVKRLHFLIKPEFDLKFSVSLISDSWPVALTLFMNVIYFRADSFLIAFYKNISDVGIYNLSYQFFQVVLVLPAFIMNSYYPILLKNFSHFKTILFGLLGASFFATIVTIVLAPILIFTLAGEGFEGSAQSLQILSFGFPAYFLSALLMWTFVTKGMYKLMLKIYTSGLILNLILNFIFIPKYSFLAAAWITVISEYAILGLQGVVLLTSQKKK